MADKKMASPPRPTVMRQGARAALGGLLALAALTLMAVLLAGESAASVEAPGASRGPSPAGTEVLAPAVASADDDGAYLNCRFGVGQAQNAVTAYDITSLNVGWYANWRAQANPARPGGIEYVQMLRVSDGAAWGGREHPDPPTYSPSGDALAAIVAAHPGSLWLVGNEPDCIWQDNVLPQSYATVYHDAYAAIKAHDPTAKVSVGGIVQPTPLRLGYMDAVLDAYASRYGEPLPTDAWNVHSYILREERGSWGCDIPPGSAADQGELYTLGDTDDIAIFKQRLRAFRGWMRDRGYRDAPLIITEYGTLMPYYGLAPHEMYYDSQGNPFDEDRAWGYMESTFDFLLTASDPDTGYPADQNRLVQRWLWYSLDDPDYGGPLFDPYTTEPLSLAVSLADYTGAISPHVDLLAVDVRQAGPVPLSPSEPATITLKARVSNVGNVAITEPFHVRFLDDQGQPIGEDRVITPSLAGCAATQAVTVTWSAVEPGAHQVQVVVDPDDGVSEPDETNNVAYGVVLVAEHRVFLPLVVRGHGSP